MAIKFEKDDGDGTKPELRPHPAKVSGEGQSATTADDIETGTETALPFAKPVRPEKKGQKIRNKPPR